MSEDYDPSIDIDVPRGYAPIPINVTSMKLQCPTCGEPVDVLDTDRLKPPDVRLNPCGHVAQVDMDKGTITRT